MAQILTVPTRHCRVFERACGPNKNKRLRGMGKSTNRLWALGLASALLMASPAVSPAWAFTDSEWPAYGHDYGDTRFSPLSQITPANVGLLKPAWTYHMRTPDRETRGFASSEDTPLVVGGTMYVSTPYGRVVALDAETGKERWAYDVPNGDQPAARGVSYWPGARPEIVFGTRAGLLIALHAESGAPVKSFGKDGVLDLVQSLDCISAGKFGACHLCHDRVRFIADCLDAPCHGS